MTADIDDILAQRAELKRRDPDVIPLFRVETEHHEYYGIFGDDIGPTIDALPRPMPPGVRCTLRAKACVCVMVAPIVLDRVLAILKLAGKRAAVCERANPGYADDWTLPAGPSGRKCARSACGATHNVVCRHTQTGEFYCPRCARKINEANPGLVEWPSPAGTAVERVATDDVGLPLDEWLREGTTVYALERYGRRPDQTRNR